MGKTFTYCLRLLLEDRDSFDIRDNNTIRNLADEPYTTVYADRFFRRQLIEINDVLRKFGFTTNLTGQGKSPTFGDAEIAIIEAYINNSNPVIEFRLIQALVAMQYEIYKRMVQSTKQIEIYKQMVQHANNAVGNHEVNGQIKF